MLLHKKQGFPEEYDLVVCTVAKVLHNSVFVNLDEYDKQGMIHISEISPGRIRNIRDYVKEGKVIVCKVLGINKEKGHIDLSLRRVSDVQRREKINQMKQEQLAEKIVEFTAKQLGRDFKKFYEELTSKVFKKHEYLFPFFEEIVLGEAKLEDFNINKKEAEVLEQLIKQRIKPKEVKIKGVVRLKTYDSEGIEIIKKALKVAEQFNSTITYLGSGKYHLIVKASDYKTAETLLKEILTKIEKIMGRVEGEFKFEREEK